MEALKDRQRAVFGSNLRESYPRSGRARSSRWLPAWSQSCGRCSPWPERRAGGRSGKTAVDRTIQQDLKLLLAIINWAARSQDEESRLLLESNRLRGLISCSWRRHQCMPRSVGIMFDDAQ